MGKYDVFAVVVVKSSYVASIYVYIFLMQTNFR